jgi:hypothetical protein
MAQLYGRTWGRSELLAHVGDINQLCGIRLAELSDGPGRGVRVADFRSGEGLSFTVLLDRGMDIGQAEYRGIPLAWLAPVGPVAPAFHEPEGSGFLRTFHGGLLTTCGLTQVGVPNVDLGEALGVHGRISHIPARLRSCNEHWEGDDYLFWAQGQVREASLFGHNLLLTRTITCRLGAPWLMIEDRVENQGDAPAPHMMLYHINPGFPMLSAASRLDVASSVQPSDAVAAAGLARHNRFERPTPGYAEQVFYHRVVADAAGFAAARLVNPDLGLALQVRYRERELPWLVEWKQMGVGAYVLGIEPGNCVPEGRASARARGTLVELAPGEAREYALEISVHAGVS